MGAARAAADGHRRLERRTGRDRQPGPRRKRVAGLLPYYILDRMAGIIDRQEGPGAAGILPPRGRRQLKDALERTWRGDRYLRAIHDDGTEIGVKGSGVWEIDALTAAWAVHVRHRTPAGPDRVRHGLAHPGTREDDPAGLAGLARGQQALPGPQQPLSRGRARERHVLPRRAMAGRRGPASWPSDAAQRRRLDEARAIARRPIGCG